MNQNFTSFPFALAHARSPRDIGKTLEKIFA
jgi:hypothetical protein